MSDGRLAVETESLAWGFSRGLVSAAVGVTCRVFGVTDRRRTLLSAVRALLPADLTAFEASVCSGRFGGIRTDFADVSVAPFDCSAAVGRAVGCTVFDGRDLGADDGLAIVVGTLEPKDSVTLSDRCGIESFFAGDC